MRASSSLALVLAPVLALAVLPASCELLKKSPSAATTTPTTTPTEPSTATAYDDAILSVVNAHRRSLGKAAFEKSQAIWAQANQHSRNMAAGTVAFGHDGFDGRVDAIRAALGSGGVVSENIATGYASAESVVNGWLGSAGHRANLEGGATRTGVSAVRSPAGMWYYTQLFY